MAYADETIIKLRAEVEQRNRETSIDLSKVQIIYGEVYSFAPNHFFDKRLVYVVPQKFSQMPEDLVAEKYLAAQKPQVILTSLDNTIDITLNLLEGKLKAEQIPLCLQKLKGAIRKAYPATLFYDEELFNESGVSVAYMDYKSFSLDGPVYNIMFVSVICNKPLIGTFNCPFDKWEQWRPVVLEMLKTIRET